MEFVLILCNGHPPGKRLVEDMAAYDPLVICADGGANTALTLGLRPGVIIGDLDSLEEGARRAFSDAQIIHENDQGSTDLEKALRWAIWQGHTRGVILGATGGRPDHFLTNLSVLDKYSAQADFRLLDDEVDIRVLRGRCEIQGEPGDWVTLLAPSPNAGVTTEGLRYPLHNESLEWGRRDGQSNKLVSGLAVIDVREGCLLMIKKRSGMLPDDWQS